MITNVPESNIYIPYNRKSYFSIKRKTYLKKKIIKIRKEIEIKIRKRNLKNILGERTS